MSTWRTDNARRGVLATLTIVFKANDAAAWAALNTAHATTGASKAELIRRAILATYGRLVAPPATQETPPPPASDESYGW